MNPFLHLDLVYQRFEMDHRLTPSHISLYVSLFLQWKSEGFIPIISLDQEHLMRKCKLRSASGYLRCIRELDLYGYLECLASDHSNLISYVRIRNFQMVEKPIVNGRDSYLEQLADYYYSRIEEAEEGITPMETRYFFEKDQEHHQEHHKETEKINHE